MFDLLKRHSYFFLTTILTLFAFLLVGFVLIEITPEENGLSNLVIENSKGFLLIRLIVYAALIGFWPLLLKRVDKHKSENKNPDHYIIVIIIAIAVCELVIVQRIPVKVFHFVSG